MAIFNDIGGDRPIIDEYNSFAHLTIEYFQVPIFDTKKFSEEKFLWINDNLKGDWTYFQFTVPIMGVTYCFKSKEDAMAFKLRWA